MIYVLIFLTFLIFAIIFDIGKASLNLAKICYVLECIILICLAGLRFRIGGDSLTYEDDFFEIPDLRYLLDTDFSKEVYQPLWIALCSICKSFGSFTALQIAQAIIVNVGMFTIIKRYSRHRFTMVLVYYVIFYLYFNTEILRQAISIIIFLFAYPYLIRKKYLRYYIYIYSVFVSRCVNIFVYRTIFVRLIQKRFINKKDFNYNYSFFNICYLLRRFN